MTSQPNVVLILADDMGYGDFGVFNDGYVRTPNLDQLVGESICLSQHYSASPVCSPARAGLLTGRYPHRTGALTPQEVLGLDRIALDEVTLGDAFQQGGYATGLVGKWHNGALDRGYHPNARGFDEFVGFRGGWADYYQWRLDVNQSTRATDGRYLTDVLTDEAIDFTRRHQHEPFLLCLMYNAPHSPLQAPEQVVQPYLDMGLKRGVAITYAMIEIMDAGIGRIMTELSQLGLDENTIVMFSSDNGPAFSVRPDQAPPGMDRDLTRFNCGFAGAKGSVYEGGIRVPMLVRWPAAFSGGTKLDKLIHATDWFPTLIKMAGIDLPPGRALDGLNVLPLLQGEEPQTEPRRFWQFNIYDPIGTVNAGMRQGPWKLVRPAVNIAFADPEGKKLLERYIQLDIDYKYHPEQFNSIFTNMVPELVIPRAAITSTL